jgi:hypothetical protein
MRTVLEDSPRKINQAIGGGELIVVNSVLTGMMHGGPLPGLLVERWPWF